MKTKWNLIGKTALGLVSIYIMTGCGADPEIADLKRRVSELEKKVSLMDSSPAEIKRQEQAERQSAGRKKFEDRLALDLQKYTRAELKEAESLYQVANKQGNTPEANACLKKMVEKFPKLNRTGCALLYLAQNSQGTQRETYLKRCIEDFNDCFYGDGVQVGAYARFQLAQDYKKTNQMEKAKPLFDELKVNFADAIDHQGKLLVTMVD